MKTSMIMLALAACLTTAVAYAADPAPTTGQQTQQWSPNTTNVAAKTRAQVRHELRQAESDGQLATLYKGN